jgi:AAT family amino acid transporter
VALFAAILVWMIILLSHLSFRRHHRAAELPVRMPLFPWMQYAGLLMLAAVLVTMGFDANLYMSWVLGVPWLILISVAYLFWRARHRLPPQGDGAARGNGWVSAELPAKSE